MLKKRLIALMILVVMVTAIIPFSASAKDVVVPQNNDYGALAWAAVDTINTIRTPVGLTLNGIRGYEDVTRKIIPFDNNWRFIPPAPVLPDTGGFIHVVAPGQTLAAIAARHGVTVSDIVVANLAYFILLAEKNTRNGTNVEVEAHMELIIPPSNAFGVVYKDLVYVVQYGETVESIARNYYGSANIAANAKRIKDANKAYFTVLNLINPKINVEAGAVLTLPGAGLKDPITRAFRSDLYAMAYIEDYIANPNPMIYVPKYFVSMYLVQKGDTLSSIAQKYFGTAAGYQMLLEANREKVSNPNNLFVGQWIVIVS